MDSQKIVSVSVLRPALIPLKPIKPNILLNLGLGIAFAVFGSLGLAFGLDLFRDHFDRPDEVEAALGTPVLASIPHLQK
jgi:capsular polysaccharide biosynthesis protein